MTFFLNLQNVIIGNQVIHAQKLIEKEKQLLLRAPKGIKERENISRYEKKKNKKRKAMHRQLKLGIKFKSYTCELKPLPKNKTKNRNPPDEKKKRQFTNHYVIRNRKKNSLSAKNALP